MILEHSRSEFQKLYPLLKEILPRTCQNCGCEDDRVHIHHIVPLSVGGSNRVTNLAVLCEKCHGCIHEIDYANHKRLQRIGIERARQKGVYMGRKPILTDEQAKELRTRASNGEKKQHLAREYNISRTSVYAYLNECRKTFQ